MRIDRVKRKYGEAADTAGAVARAMEQAYRLGFEEGLIGTLGVAASQTAVRESEPQDALEWAKIPPRTRSTFWSICLAALGRTGRTGRTETSSYLVVQETRRRTPVWGLVVPDRQTYDKTVGDGTIVTLVRLGLLQHMATDEPQVRLTQYGIRTWNRFCERGGQWPGDLIETLR